jgi:hypothetical protein
VLEIAGILLVILLVAGLSGCCERLFYYPDAAVYSSPDDYGLRFETVSFQSPDGTELSGWFLPAVGPPRGTIVHCHGNAQNMTAHWLFVKFLPREGYNLFVFDYRGYGRSAGKPTRSGTVEDARAAIEYVLGREDVDASRVGILGQSIGGAVAVVVAAEDARIRGAVIDSSFSSYRDEAAHALRQNPLTWLLAWPLSRCLIRSGLDPVDHVADISPRPVLFIHGTADRVVPADMSRELMERAGEPKELWLVEDARHTGAIYIDEAAYRRQVCGLFERAFQSGE